MNRTAALVTIALLSSIATPMVVGATGTATKAPEAAVIVQAKADVMAAVTAPSGDPACARKVKVVYAGYSNEGNSVPCAVSGKQASR